MPTYRATGRRWVAPSIGAALAVLGCIVGCGSIFDAGEDLASPSFLPHNPSSDVIFPHDVHSSDCAGCHPNIDPHAAAPEDVEDPTVLLRPAKTACFSCHERGQDCATCHRHTRSEVRPASHTPGFRRAHGNEARRLGARCDWCHGRRGTADGCQNCHSVEKPADHGPRWKNSGHGRAAVFKRDRCFVCHRSDQCARCHAQPPETHSAAFMQGLHGTIARRKLRSCYTCHSFESSCAKCHPASP